MKLTKINNMSDDIDTAHKYCKQSYKTILDHDYISFGEVSIIFPRHGLS